MLCLQIKVGEDIFEVDLVGAGEVAGAEGREVVRLTAGQQVVPVVHLRYTTWLKETVSRLFLFLVFC